MKIALNRRNALKKKYSNKIKDKILCVGVVDEKWNHVYIASMKTLTDQISYSLSSSVILQDEVYGDYELLNFQ